MRSPRSGLSGRSVAATAAAVHKWNKPVADPMILLINDRQTHFTSKYSHRPACL